MTFEAELSRQLQQPLEIQPLRALLEDEQKQIAEAFYQGTPVKKLVRRRSDVIDLLLQGIWQQTIQLPGDCALVAVGGYGRRELHPHSDVDLLILLEDENRESQQQISSFVTLLWDLGLQIGQSVRSIGACLEESKQDITVATNLLESRLLSGPAPYFKQLKQTLSQDSIWASGPFFIAKRNEQQARHAKYDDTAYNLEPNIKEGPGGLRDIQNILWVTRRHFGSNNLKELVDHHFLTKSEYSDLAAKQERLWEIRFALHLIAGRAEERLLFDYQPELARHFGHLDSELNQGVESFMHSYFRVIHGLSLLNEMLLQLFEEKLLTPVEQRTPNPINDHCGIQGGYLTLLRHDALQHHPELALELFHTLLDQPNLKGLTAETIRHLWTYRQQVADHFRDHLPTRHRFLELFHRGEGLTHTLRRMNRYGLLGDYLPEFEKIVGLMQHDLFHAYTVDEHTLFVVRNLRRFTVAEHHQEFPLQSRMIAELKHPERLYLAGLFHDIAKGRGGNHSELGVEVVHDFCSRLEIEAEMRDEVAWLVENHLAMSTFAQRRDIDDPDEIRNFAEIVGNQTRLNMLYLLTVADIRATNQNLWNHFKSALLLKLYNATSQLLGPTADTSPYQEQADRKQALQQLLSEGIARNDIEQFWQGLGEEYFQKHDAQDIYWHTLAILKQPERPLIAFHKQSHQGGSEILVYTPDQKNLFSILAHTLEAHHLDIQAARINTTCNSYALDIFTVLDQNGKTLEDPEQLQRIEHHLKEEINDPRLIHQPINYRRSRHQKHFHNQAKVRCRQDERKRQTVLEINATDRPGLLSALCQVFMSSNIRIHGAKIATLGERVEDIFWVTHQDKRPLDEQEIDQVITPQICSALDQE